MVRTVIAVVAAALLAGCAVEAGPGAVGEVCQKSDDCDDGLECVIMAEGKPVCLPVPTERTPTDGECSVDARCTLSNQVIWPVEVHCVEGSCQCTPDARTCGAGRTCSAGCVCVDEP